MRRAQIGLIVVVALTAAAGASAQTVNRVDLDRAELSRADCEAGAEPIELDIDLNDVASAQNLSLRGVFLADVTTTQGRLQCVTNQAGTTLFSGLEVTNVIPTQEIAPRTLLGDACGEEGARVDGAVCVFLDDDSSGRVLTSLGTAFSYDTDVPERPTIDNARPGTNRIAFDVGNVDDTTNDVHEFLVQYRPCRAPEDAGPGDGGAEPSDGGAGELVAAESICDAPDDFQQTVTRSRNVSIGDLENGVEYEVRVLVRDDYDNTSEPSEAVTVTPREGQSPLDFYNGSGSPYSMAPSCAGVAGGTSLFGLVALLGVGLWPRRRRHRRAGARSGAWLSLALLPALFGALPSAAQDFEPESATTAPRNGEVTFSLFAGPYRPAIDTESGIFPIYRCFFDDATLVNLGASVDYHLLDVFGSLQLGVGVEGTQAKGKALQPGVTTVEGCGQKTDDSVELTIVKVKPQLTYRLDPLLDWFGFPLVPYGRVALVGAGYAFTENGLFSDAETEAQNPLGVVLGYEAAGGLMLALDFWDYLDPFSKWGTLRGRANGVFNHAFVYGEALWQPIDNFGRPSLVLSPTDPFTGTTSPWTVHFGVAVELL